MRRDYLKIAGSAAKSLAGTVTDKGRRGAKEAKKKTKAAKKGAASAKRKTAKAAKKGASSAKEKTKEGLKKKKEKMKKKRRKKKGRKRMRKQRLEREESRAYIEALDEVGEDYREAKREDFAERERRRLGLSDSGRGEAPGRRSEEPARRARREAPAQPPSDREPTQPPQVQGGEASSMRATMAFPEVGGLQAPTLGSPAPPSGGAQQSELQSGGGQSTPSPAPMGMGMFSAPSLSGSGPDQRGREPVDEGMIAPAMGVSPPMAMEPEEPLDRGGYDVGNTGGIFYPL